MSHAFDRLAVEAAIAGTRFAGALVHLPSTPSTQDLALAAGQRGAAWGVWVADEQTAGRGRGAHAWHSSPGDGLYLSALVTPVLPLAHALHLSLATALAAQTAIAEVGGFRPRQEIDIRWPNDLMLRGRKCGGILIETAVQPGRSEDFPPQLRHAIIGVGINCNHAHFPPDLERIATSMRLASAIPDRRVSREAVLGALLVYLDDAIDRLVRSEGKAGSELVREISQRSSWVEGKRVVVGEANSLFRGVTAGLTAEGFLRVLDDEGRLRIVRSGGVREAV